MGYIKTLTVLLICTLPLVVQALQIQIGFNNPFVYIQVGKRNQIDEISFSFPVGVQPGDGTSITGTSANLPVAVLAYSGSGQANFRVTMDSSTPLTSNEGYTIPFSEFSWTTRDGDLNPGRFNNTANQLWQQFSFNHPRGRGVRDFLTFRYDNNRLFPPGTYTGRVVYTITEL